MAGFLSGCRYLDRKRSMALHGGRMAPTPWAFIVLSYRRQGHAFLSPILLNEADREGVSEVKRTLYFCATSVAFLFLSAAPAGAQPAGEQPVNVVAFTSGDSRQVDFDVYTVRDDSQLIIDYVSFQARVPVGERVLSGLINLPHAHFLVVNAQGDDGFYDYFTGAQQTRIVIGPGQTIKFRIERSNYGSAAFASATLAGRLVRLK